MKVKKLFIASTGYPTVLQDISGPPKQLFVLGGDFDDLLTRPRVAVVGSRSVTPYGKSVTMQLAGELAAKGIVIVSGLALGVDAIAHRAALEAGGLTIAVLPSGLNHIYPATNRNLAKQILEQGGALVTEYETDGTMSFKANFIARNRIVSGLSDAVLITEAAEKSGSLHTARFALEQGRDVLAVPGNITSPTSVGTNNLIKSGATPVTSVNDVLYALGIDPSKPQQVKLIGATPDEQMLLDLLSRGISDGHELLIKSSIAIPVFNQTLTMLEITGKVRSLGNNHWSLK
ncbi:MAG: DNA-processing protein DprA [Candidatus Saccharimonadales bacterium]